MTVMAEAAGSTRDAFGQRESVDSTTRHRRFSEWAERRLRVAASNNQRHGVSWMPEHRAVSQSIPVTVCRPRGNLIAHSDVMRSFRPIGFIILMNLIWKHILFF